MHIRVARDFKEDIIQAFYDGIKHKPETTFGNVKADVLADKDPHFAPRQFLQRHRGVGGRRSPACGRSTRTARDIQREDGAQTAGDPGDGHARAPTALRRCANALRGLRRVAEPPMPIEGEAAHFDHRVDDDHWEQPGNLFRKMNAAQRQMLFENTARAMGDAKLHIKQRHIANCTKGRPGLRQGRGRCDCEAREGSAEPSDRGCRIASEAGQSRRPAAYVEGAQL